MSPSLTTIKRSYNHNHVCDCVRNMCLQYSLEMQPTHKRKPDQKLLTYAAQLPTPPKQQQRPLKILLGHQRHSPKYQVYPGSVVSVLLQNFIVSSPRATLNQSPLSRGGTYTEKPRACNNRYKEFSGSLLSGSLFSGSLFSGSLFSGSLFSGSPFTSMHKIWAMQLKHAVTCRISISLISLSSCVWDLQSNASPAQH